MRLLRRILMLLVVVVVTLAANAYFVDREQRSAAPFFGGHVLQLDGPDLNVREYGPPGDRAVVLLHGYSASIEWWEKVAPELARTHRVIAIDLVGHGGSEAPRDPAQYGATGQAAAVRRALDALGVRHALLVGHSMGGHIATAVAEAEPGRVDRIVVSDTYGASGLKAMPALGSLACWPLIGPAADRLRGVDAITDSALQAGFAPGYPVPELAHRSLKQLTHTGVCDSTAGDELNAAKPVAEQLAGLGKPVLVVWGAQDVLTPTGTNVQRYTEAGLPPRIIAGSGHSPMVEKPQDFLAAVSDFLK
ncbi:alpha/beta fold hydrolase [Mycobacterium sp. CBMA271]|uniref:alpha/beta fold hydrolase n=1 Tax=unclassified Mycobacteroides TaxID=2618759 RepID=UPI0012DE7896|nr:MULTISPECIES: alpha/beta fold hydrolase [unclassified Mycobacteroides]MUM19958.1 alpha/beta hydrolase [Mycobacteroides sp. CBMA 326]MUM20132.1 alpha/beta fold hydrolase [Mycobacteroides sp. CBMA 271]